VLHYTIGQRKGLGIAAGEPLYVVAIDAERNEVVLGRKNETYSSVAMVSRPTFVAGAPPAEEFRATARIRYRTPARPALSASGGTGWRCVSTRRSEA
jgi:tRNA-specific 2-thiouridylase